ncbi:sensor histidine kinase [Gehongia tenuis]|uniref:histidine kinase n=1 Tax=Gehongia tenuis TaxID=2763655 RepID=A0A926D575_9FIRM|nr:HAMP domain-containing sensor histidine kinase [Gehongia tenuis]MBC8531826.1 HAMP domain-containing histidine kinase [Gehongia tenuis]
MGPVNEELRPSLLDEWRERRRQRKSAPKASRRTPRKRRTWRERIDRMSLRKAFIVYILGALVMALITSFIFVFWMQESANDIYRSAQNISLEYNALYTVPHSGYELSSSDSFMLSFYGAASIAGPVILFLLWILMAYRQFYRTKLKRPFELLQKGAARIAASDLDFSFSYPAGDELGTLCQAFERMRGDLAENNRRMWRMMEERRRVNAAFAHDLRTPITVIKGYTEFLQTYWPEGKLSDEKISSTLTLLHDSTQRLEDYVASMRALQNLEELQPDPKALDGSSFSNGLESALTILAKEYDKRIEFHSSIKGELRFDGAMVLRTAENLAANALRYAQSRVLLDMNVQDGFLWLCCTDDGPGFTAEGLKMAGEPFYRAEKKPSGELSGHFGLGLNIVRTLSEKHGGNASFGNAPEGGAAVTVSFRLS